MQEYQFNGVDDVHSHERYETLVNAFANSKDYSLDFIKNLLSGKMGFMCQYDRKQGLDTVWSSIYDLTEGTILELKEILQEKYSRRIKGLYSQNEHNSYGLMLLNE